MWKYFLLLTDLRGSEVDAMREEVARGKLHPMAAKKNLARTIVAGFHGVAAAESADENWARMFQQKGESEDLEEVAVAFGDVTDSQGHLLIPRLLVKIGLAASNSEANRKIAEKAVRLDGDLFGGLRIKLPSLPARIVVRLGKRAKIAVVA
ncbi:MAG: tyrosine--tRNA ligase, partial [Terracidiphilus sp.]